MPPTEPNDEEKLEELPGDEGQTPFTPAGASRDDGADPQDDRQVDEATEESDKTEPVLDTDVDETELYQQGQEDVGSNLGSDVEGYDPEKDQRQQ